MIVKAYPERMTPEEFEALSDSKGLELIDGVVQEKHVGFENAAIQSRIGFALNSVVIPAKLGEVVDSEAMYQCFPGRPKQIRKPDVSFVLRQRLPDGIAPRGMCKVRPDFVVEVVSPNDTYEEVDEKLADYFEAGVPLIWVVTPKSRTVLVYRADGTARRFRDTDDLTADPIIPGFRVRIAELFPNPPEQPDRRDTAGRVVMRIAILSGGTGWHVQDALRAARELGHDAAALDFRALHAGANDPLAAFDAVLVRTMPAGSLEQVVFRMDLLHEAAARGQTVLNPPRAVEVCVDKYLTTARLVRAGIPTPATVVCQRSDDAMTAFADLGGDAVLKPLFGAEGRGMCRLTDPETAWRTVRVLEQTGQVIYLQRFVRHPGWDLRAFVIGGRVIASMRRVAGNDWRTNVAQGGTAERVTLTDDEAELAVRAAEAVGCPVAGVDLLPGPGGELFVIEVNGVPGWKALAAACEIDVAKEVVRFLTRE